MSVSEHFYCSTKQEKHCNFTSEKQQRQRVRRAPSSIQSVGYLPPRLQSSADWLMKNSPSLQFCIFFSNTSTWLKCKHTKLLSAWQTCHCCALILHQTTKRNHTDMSISNNTRAVSSLCLIWAWLVGMLMLHTLVYNWLLMTFDICALCKASWAGLYQPTAYLSMAYDSTHCNASTNMEYWKNTHSYPSEKILVQSIFLRCLDAMWYVHRNRMQLFTSNKENIMQSWFGSGNMIFFLALSHIIWHLQLPTK